jgi:hypothetical protein
MYGCKGIPEKAEEVNITKAFITNVEASLNSQGVTRWFTYINKVYAVCDISSDVFR